MKNNFDYFYFKCIQVSIEKMNIFILIVVKTKIFKYSYNYGKYDYLFPKCTNCAKVEIEGVNAKHFF